MLTEFGGIAFSPDTTHVGIFARRAAEELANGISQLLQAVRSIRMLAGFCYTQFADTYQEANGLLYADRTPKFPMEDDRAGDARARRPQVISKWNGSGGNA